MPDRQGNMTMVERKVLREIIRDDYKILENNVSQQLSEWEAKRLNEIKAKYAKKREDAKRQYRKLADKLNKLRDEETTLRRTLDEEGFDFSGSTAIFGRVTTMDVPSFVVKAEKEELDSLKNEVRLFRSRIANDLFSKERSQWKQVALESLNSDRAKELVMQVPEADDVMRELTAATASA